MVILRDSNSYSDSGEIIVPVVLKLFVYPEIQEMQGEKKQSVGYSPIQKPISESSVAGDDDERLFVYEVIGLRSKVCRTGQFSLTVPYHRMNQEMQRLTRQGGQIVGVRPKI